MLVMVRAEEQPPWNQPWADGWSCLNLAVFPLSDESKVLDGASELQLDCVVEESSGSGPVKLALTDLSRPGDFSAPPRNGLALPVEPSEIKADPAAADTSASSGEREWWLI